MKGRYFAVLGELCRHFELKNTADLRHDITRWILGYDKSSTKFTGKEYALVIDAIREWIAGDIQPGPLDHNEQARRSHDETQKQLIHAIEQLAPDQYVQAVANKRHGKRPWRHQSAYILRKLRMTIKRAHDRKAKTGGSLFRD